MKDKIEKHNLPKHIAVIMDGNGRWAKQKGIIDRLFGHKNAITAVRETIEGCGELGVEFLTLYAFSTENWNRPKLEVDGLMTLLVSTINDELSTMMRNNVRLLTIGDLNSLSARSKATLLEAIETTKNNKGLSLVLALSYSGKWDIVNATKKIAEKIENKSLSIDQISEDFFENQLSTNGMPDPDLMIRTGGDYRISNFLLWQLAYTEFYIFDQLYWPDFRREHLHEAILSYQERERRFGKTSEQIQNIK